MSQAQTFVIDQLVKVKLATSRSSEKPGFVKCLGKVRFFGQTEFASGKWVGIELIKVYDGEDSFSVEEVTSYGKNNGSVNGKEYFNCADYCGVFVRPGQAVPVEPEKRVTSSELAGSEERVTSDPKDTNNESNLIKNEQPSSTSSGKLPSRRMSMMSASRSSSSRSRQARMSLQVQPAQSGLLKSTSRRSQRYSLAPMKSNSHLNDPQSPLHEQPSSSIEKTVPLREYEELRLRMKLLENKRLEDREKMKKMAVAESSAQELDSLVSGLRESLRSALSETDKHRRQLQEQESLNQELSEKLSSLSHTNELLLMDKQVAEESNAQMQQEVDSLTERVEELQLDLEIYQDSAALAGEEIDDNMEIGSGDSLPAGGNISLQDPALKEQNERLREALVKLRDISSQTENELKTELTSVKRKLQEYEKKLESDAALREKLADSEALVIDLKQQLDEHQDNADIAERLTVRNLKLTEQIEELKDECEQLETLKELSEELEEHHLETERELRQELEQQEDEINQMVSAFDEINDVLADRDTMMGKYRQLVASLQSDVQSLRQQLESHQKDADTNKNVAILTSETQKMQELRIQLESSSKNTLTSSTTRSKAVQLELDHLYQELLEYEMHCLDAFLPGNFKNRIEYQCINLVIISRRASFKAELISRFIKGYIENDLEAENESSPRNGLLFKRQVALACHYLLLMAASLADIEDLFTHLNLNIIEFVFADTEQLSVVEKRLDEFIDNHLLNAQVNPNTNERLQIVSQFSPDMLEGLSRLLSMMQHLVFKILETERKNSSTKSSIIRQWNQCPLLMLQSLESLLQVHEVQFSLLESKPGLSDAHSDSNEASFNEDKTQKLKQSKAMPYVDKIPNLRSSLRQVCNLLSELPETSIGKSERSMISSLLQSIRRLCGIDEDSTSSGDGPSKAWSKIIVQQIEDLFTMDGNEESSNAGSNLITIDNISHQYLSQQMDIILGQVKRIEERLLNLNANFQDNQQIAVKETDTWVERAAAFYKEFKLENIKIDKDPDAATMNPKTTMAASEHNLSEQLLSSQQELKQKEELLDENMVKIQLLEKKLENLRNKSQMINHYERELDKMKSDQKMYTDTMDSLQAELEKLTAENSALKKKFGVGNTSRTPTEFGSPLRSGQNGQLMFSDLGNPALGASGSFSNSQLSLSMQSPSKVSHKQQAAVYFDIYSMKSALNQLKQENIALRSKISRKKLTELIEQAPIVPKHRMNARKTHILTANTNMIENEKTLSEPLNSSNIYQNTKTTIQDMLMASSSLRLVNIAKSAQLSSDKTVKIWRSKASYPEFEFNRQLSIIYTLKKQSNELLRQFNSPVVGN